MEIFEIYVIHDHRLRVWQFVRFLRNVVLPNIQLVTCWSRDIRVPRMSEIKTNLMLPAFRTHALSGVMGYMSGAQSRASFSARSNRTTCYLCELKKIRNTHYFTCHSVFESVISYLSII